MTKKKELDFYFDYLSNNAYIAWFEIQKMCVEFDLKLNPCPVLFPALLAANKQAGPAEIEAKREWMAVNVIRKAKLLDIPLSLPASHPFNPLLALRASIVAINNAVGIEMMNKLFTACWADSKDISDPETIKEIAQDAGLDPDLIISESNNELTKKELAERTESAIKRGVFGVPTMIIEGQRFWGYDDFQYLRLYLEGNDPFTPSMLNAWQEIKPTARRKGVL